MNALALSNLPDLRSDTLWRTKSPDKGSLSENLRPRHLEVRP
jgi:hypothetical protein